MVNTSDLRVIKTRATIEQAFIQILEQKDFERITVQNILEEALVNRKTFYKHYEDKYHLADCIIEQLIGRFSQALMERLEQSAVLSGNPDVMRRFYHTIFKDRDMMLALFKVRTDHHYLWDDLMEVLKSAYLESMSKSKSHPSELEADYLCLSYATYALSSIKWALALGSSEAIEIVVDSYSRHPPSPGFVIWPPWPMV